MQALVVVGHGSLLNPSSSVPTYAHADRIRRTGAFAEVREAFWKEEPAIREVLRTVEAETVYVVPLFMSEGYFTEQIIPRELRIADGWELDVDKDVRYGRPVGTHQAMTDVIVRRAENVTGDPDVGPDTGLAIVGHGTERNENSARSTHYHADRIRSRERFSEVRALFLDEEPHVEHWADHFETPDVVVVPLFVADGYHTQEDLPRDLGIATESDCDALATKTEYDAPTVVEGKRVWYAGAVGTEPLVASLICQRAHERGASVGDAIERLATSVDGQLPTSIA